jgi:hypothetical protein
LLSLLDHQTQLQLQEAEAESPWITCEDRIQGRPTQPAQIPPVGHPWSNDEREYLHDQVMVVWYGSCHHNRFHLQSKPPVVEAVGEVGAADLVVRIPVARVWDLLAKSSTQVETFAEFPGSCLAPEQAIDQETWLAAEVLLLVKLVHGHG